MSQPFESLAIETDYAFLDRLPDELITEVATHPIGDLRERVLGIAAWRDALLQGEMPELHDLSWPPPELAVHLHRTVDELGIATFCRNQPELVDAFVNDLLHCTVSASNNATMDLGAIIDELLYGKRPNKAPAEVTDQDLPKEWRGRKGKRLRQRLKRIASHLLNAKGPSDSDESGRVGGTPVSEEDKQAWERLVAAVRNLVERRRKELFHTYLDKSWAAQIQLWRELAEIFGELRELMGLSWDLSRGVLRHHGWVEIARLRKLVAELPKLRALIRTLGRMRDSKDADQPSVMDEVFVEVRRTREELREVRAPNIPAETRGVERSGSIARMLPPEAACLGHPVLRYLWHARRAEQSLMSYRVEGVFTERIAEEIGVEEARLKQRPRPERGPIIVCVDTSGSMEGTPELVAKAVTLEAMRVAYQEQRRCFLYAFSGPGQVAEHELELSEGGLAGLLAFLSSSFHGGTDVSLPIERAVNRLSREEWQRSDVLLISDGEFGVSPELEELITGAKNTMDAKLHGLLIGTDDRAMQRLCDPVHRFESWEIAVEGRRDQQERDGNQQ